MEIISKVWHFNVNENKKLYREYKLNLSSDDINKLISSVNNDYLNCCSNQENINLIENATKIPKNNIIFTNCKNIYIENNKITLLSDIYTTKKFFRTLKIEKLLYGK